MTVEDILSELKANSTSDHFNKIAYFGIDNSKALGVKVPLIRQIAKKTGKNHELALALWKTDIHEARLLASMIENPKMITEKQFDSWVSDFDSWDICDQSCSVLGQTKFSLQKINEYSVCQAEFVKRTAFVLMCEQSLHHKSAENELFYHFFDLIELEAWDDRNFVRKAVNWALRQIGKRNEILRRRAIETCERILQQDSKSARWIAKDALRELNNPGVIARINKQKNALW
jgi:3-methyladenine DNA glycosylase AlkD